MQSHGYVNGGQFMNDTDNRDLSSRGGTQRGVAGGERELGKGSLTRPSSITACRDNVTEIGSCASPASEVLAGKGLSTSEKLESRKASFSRQHGVEVSGKGVGLVILADTQDKYIPAFEKKVDCLNRLSVCRAACCRFPIPLSRQDVEEGRICWDPSRPYLIAKGKNGYCCHIDRDHLACTIREYRPLECRAYDCRLDGRVWGSFDQMLLNPKLEEILAMAIGHPGQPGQTAPSGVSEPAA
jgi:Fe-S-cluster containining protein